MIRSFEQCFGFQHSELTPVYWPHKPPEMASMPSSAVFDTSSLKWIFPHVLLSLSFVTKMDVRHKSVNFNSLQLYQILATVLGISTAQTSSNYKKLKALSFLLNFSSVPFNITKVVCWNKRHLIGLRKTRILYCGQNWRDLTFVSRDVLGWNYDKQVYLRLGHESSI